MRARRAVLVLAAVVAAPAVLVGCRPGSALHGRYNDFRAYYNTFYNAERKLEEGETALRRPDAPVDRALLVDVFPYASASGGQSGPFQEAIDKSAELLRNRPDSKWADDALLLIGKAYFYQRNIVGAEQKFRETLAAAEATGGRRLAAEARFWLGRTYAAAERYDDGVETLELGLAEEDVDRRWAAQMRLALGELYARAGRWDEAADALRAGAPDAGDADLAARAYLLLGQVEEEASRFEAAAEAYGAALDERPVYELAFAAEVGRALVLGLDVGDTEAALDGVARMLRDDKHYARRGELALVRARLLADAGRDAAALALFRDVLYDEDLEARSVRGEAHYRLGEFYRDARGDYVRAAAHFDTAATALPQVSAAAPPSRAALLGVDDQAQTYGALAASARRVAEVDSLLALGALSDEAFAARIEEIEAERARLYVEEQRRLQAERQAQAFAGGGGPVQFDRQQGGEAAGGPDAAFQTGAGGPGGGPGGNVGEAGFLAHRDPAALLAGQVAFEQRWGDRPLVPNWRRRAAIQAGPVASPVGGLGRTGETDQLAFGEGPPRLDLSKVPRTPAKREELVTELAGLRYELANAFFLSLGRADTAAVLYQAVLDETPDLPVAVRARYALAEIELSAGREAAARPLYEAVVAADTAGTLAAASRLRLGLSDPDGAAGPAAATETTAAYDAARALWRAGRPREAAADLVAFADADPDAPLAPRAYLAAASAYAEWAAGDTLVLAGPLPPGLVSPVLASVPADAPPPEQPDAAEFDAAEFEAPESEGVGTEEVGAPEPGALDDEPRLPAPLPPEPDTPLLGGPEIPRVGADGAPAPPDSSAAPPDSSASPPDSSAALPLSPAFTLRRYLGALASLYPATPYADRARQLVAALPDPPALPVRSFEPDSLASDSLAADSLAAPPAADSLGALPPADDSLGVPLAPDAARALGDLPDEPPAPEPLVEDSAADEPPPGPLPGVPSDGPPSDDGPGDVFGVAPVDPSLGGFSWRVGRLDAPADGERTATALRAGGYPVTAAYDEAEDEYLLLVGQFATAEEGEATRRSLPAWAQVRSELVPVSGLAVVEDGAESEG
jgi:TolA-binding protein